ncbi:MAG: hypothetical protein A3I02_01275 [Betaproteobacteria bacterium RIFCSPLOWO2_02_FULL_67_26]|nr:MAG: hypothetical protein A3I02_01275 [Betaproteobacteria bacterium RIFCSPLOWO2_02_FULL_67_26]
MVLFVHGGYSPSVVAYDLDYKDYSFMAVLARAGFDVFALTHTGYGASPKPLMDDPCNVDPANQALIIPHALAKPCAPRYPFKLVSSRTEWEEIETTVNYIRALRGVERVSLVGWSSGAPRVGGFAALHPEQVDKLVLFGPSPFFPSDEPPAEMPEPGAPVILQTKEMLLEKRWRNDVRCDGQVDDPDVREVMWRELIRQDGLGARWRPEGVMRAPSRTNFGWRRNAAAIQAPALVLVGEFDNYAKRREAWAGFGMKQKVFIKVACASHFIQYERGRHFLHRAAREWLETGAIDGAQRAELQADVEGKLGSLRDD